MRQKKLFKGCANQSYKQFKFFINKGLLSKFGNLRSKTYAETGSKNSWPHWMPTAVEHRPTLFSLRGPEKALHQRAPKARVIGWRKGRKAFRIWWWYLQRPKKCACPSRMFEESRAVKTKLSADFNYFYYTSYLSNISCSLI